MPPKKELLLNDRILSEKFDVSIKTIQRWKDKYGLRKKSRRLTETEVKDIRTSKETVKHLAKKYNKTLAAIYRIKNNVTYKTVVQCSGSAIVY